MISYYDLLLLIESKKQPDKVLISVEEGQLLFCWNNKYNTYYVQPTTVTEKWYKKYSEYLFDNIDEEDFFNQNISVHSVYRFSIGEYVSYFDLLNAIRFDSEPYRVRIHINDKVNDYIYKNNNYIEYEDDGNLPTWESYLCREVGYNNLYDKNIEIIELGNNLLGIKRGNYGSSYFNIMPVTIKDINDDTDATDNVVEHNEYCIAIEEDDLTNYLLDILLKNFNDSLIENQNRSDVSESTYSNGITSTFEYYLTHNFYTLDDIKNIISEIKETLKMNDEQLNNRFDNHDNLIEIRNFYIRLCDFLENMISTSIKNNYKLISIIGP